MNINTHARVKNPIIDNEGNISKVCSRCKVTKLAECFYVYSKGYLSSRCVECKKETYNERAKQISEMKEKKIEPGCMIESDLSADNLKKLTRDVMLKIMQFNEIAELYGVEYFRLMSYKNVLQRRHKCIAGSVEAWELFAPDTVN